MSCREIPGTALPAVDPMPDPGAFDAVPPPADPVAAEEPMVEEPVAEVSVAAAPGALYLAPYSAPEPYPAPETPVPP